MMQPCPDLRDLKLVGQGGEGRVFSACLNNGTRVAVKQRPARHMRKAREEQQVLKMLASANIIKAPEICTGSDESVLEIYQLYSCDLHTLIETPSGAMAPLPIGQARAFSRQLAAAITFCHSKNVAHLDIKLENVLVDTSSDSIVLADFGAARRADRPYTKRLGTRNFCAPECWGVGVAPHFPESYCVRAADIWSFGQCVLAMTTGHTAGWNTAGAVSWRKTAEQYNLPADICEVLEYTLNFDPAGRASAADLMKLSWLQTAVTVSPQLTSADTSPLHYTTMDEDMDGVSCQHDRTISVTSTTSTSLSMSPPSAAASPIPPSHQPSELQLPPPIAKVEGFSHRLLESSKKQMSAFGQAIAHGPAGASCRPV